MCKKRKKVIIIIIKLILYTNIYIYAYLNINVNVIPYGRGACMGKYNNLRDRDMSYNECI